MRYIVTVAALILSYATTASYAQQANVSRSGHPLMWKISRCRPWPCTWESQGNRSSSTGPIFR